MIKKLAIDICRNALHEAKTFQKDYTWIKFWKSTHLKLQMIRIYTGLWKWILQWCFSDVQFFDKKAKVTGKIENNQKNVAKNEALKNEI